MPSQSDRQHSPFDNPAKALCRDGNLRVLREAAYRRRGRVGTMTLHLASAEASGADFFCTCDDRVLKKAAKQKGLRVGVVSPLQLAEEVSR